MTVSKNLNFLILFNFSIPASIHCVHIVLFDCGGLRIRLDLWVPLAEGRDGVGVDEGLGGDQPGKEPDLDHLGKHNTIWGGVLLSREELTLIIHLSRPKK